MNEHRIDEELSTFAPRPARGFWISSSKPLAGYAGAEAALVRELGMRVLARWRGRATLPKIGQPLRLAVSFGPLARESLRPGDISLYALDVS